MVGSRNIAIFDCDGTAADSEIIAMPMAGQYVKQFAARHGIEVTEEFIQGLFGKDMKIIAGIVQEKFNLVIPDTAVAELHQQTLEALSRDCRPTLGVVNFLNICQTLSQTGKIADLAICSSSKMDRVRGALQSSRLLSYFAEDRIFSAHESLPTPKPKPAPDVYLHTLLTMGVSRHDHVMTFEDSPTGVESARVAWEQFGLNPQTSPIIGYVGGSHIVAAARTDHGKLLISKGATHIITHWREAEIILNPWLSNDNGRVQRQVFAKLQAG